MGLPTPHNMRLVINVMDFVRKRCLQSRPVMSYEASFLPRAAVSPVVGRIPFEANFPSQELL